MIVQLEKNVSQLPYLTFCLALIDAVNPRQLQPYNLRIRAYFVWVLESEKWQKTELTVVQNIAPSKNITK